MSEIFGPGPKSDLKYYAFWEEEVRSANEQIELSLMKLGRGILHNQLEICFNEL